MLTQQTAYEIWVAYDEIAKGHKLIEDMESAIRDGSPPDLRDAFGRQRNLQLGVPSGQNGHRLFDVAPRLAISIIRAHIAEKQAILEATNERAKIEVL